MEITFLIGNGFDLQMGLRTGYRDFLRWYIGEGETAETVETAGDRVVGGGVGNAGETGETHPTTEHETQERKAAAIRQFKQAVRRDLDSWADFELAMGAYTAQFGDAELADCMHVVEDVKVHLMAYLQAQEMGFCWEGKEGTIAWEMRRILQTAAKGMSQMERKMGMLRYHFINFNYTRIFDRCLALVGEQPAAETERSEMRRGKCAETDASDRAGAKATARSNKRKPAEVAFCLGEVLHIHGTTEGYSLLGVNDESQIANRKAAFNSWFQRRFIKPLSNETLRGSSDKRAIDWIRRSDVICIFGMSIGKTDAFWWKHIGRWLRENRKHRLILVTGKERFLAGTRELRKTEKLEVGNPKTGNLVGEKLYALYAKKADAGSMAGANHCTQGNAAAWKSRFLHAAGAAPAEESALAEQIVVSAVETP